MAVSSSNPSYNYNGEREEEEEEVNQLLISNWWTGITLSAAEMLAMRSRPFIRDADRSHVAHVPAINNRFKQEVPPIGHVRP
ncbi:unnamed protein product [Lasius platythorax]|uniref:Uncharacterized protein n=1 Tax=Lasius platythorax TaxID=488582 RepID=A0AAV2NTP7_9HYME